MKELWALLHFLDAHKFPDSQSFEATYSMSDSESIAQLHTDLRPHLLRRVIKDVEKSLPPKSERILRVELSPLQRQYYRWILTRNYHELNKGAKAGAQVSLLNIVIELKKAGGTGEPGRPPDGLHGCELEEDGLGISVW